MNVTVRKADVPVILSLIKQFSLFQKTPERVTISLEEMVKESDSFRCMVAETNDKQIAGFASYYFAWYSWSGKDLYLDDLYVTETNRKTGIGRRLLHSVIDTAKRAACKKVKWQVSKWNENAIGFYKSVGAEIDDIEVNCNLNIED